MTAIADHPLNDQTSLPPIGLGTYSLNGDEGAESIAAAVRAGYRLLDTASSYGNEDAVGEGVRRSGVDRDTLVVTSKVPNGHHGLGPTRAAFEQTLSTLAMDRVDLYLIHWPQPEDDLFVETWKAMIEFRDQGRATSIGVSNFTADQLDRLIDETGVAPSVNQIPVNLYQPHPAWREANRARGVLTESYSPLKFGERLRADPTVTRIAAAHGVSANQVALRWNLQLGAVPIPRSRSVQHQRENLDVFGFELDVQEMADLDTLAGNL